MEAPVVPPQRELTWGKGFGKAKVDEINVIINTDEDVIELQVVMDVTRRVDVVEDGKEL